MVVVKVVDSVEEDSEDIKLSVHHLSMIKSRVGIYINTKTVTDTLTINRRRKTHFTKGGQHEYICG